MAKLFSFRFLIAIVAVLISQRVPAIADSAIWKAIPKDSIAFNVTSDTGAADRALEDISFTHFLLPFPSTVLLTPSLMAQQLVGFEDFGKVKGDAAVILYPKEKEGYIWVLVLSAKESEKLLSQFDIKKVTESINSTTADNGRKAIYALKGGYLFFAGESDQEALEAFIAAKESVASEMASWKAWTDRTVSYTVLTNHAIKKGIPSYIKEYESFCEVGEPANLQITMLKGIHDNLKQCGIGLVSTDDGTVKILTRCDAIPESRLAKMCRDVKKLPVDPLSVLPTDSSIVAGGGPCLPGLAKIVAQFYEWNGNEEFGLDVEQRKKIFQLVADADADMLGWSFSWGLPISGEKGTLQNTCASLWVKDADSCLATYAKQIRSLHDMLKNTKSPSIKIDTQEMMIDGHKTLVITLVVPEKDEEPEMQNGTLRSLFGEDPKIKVFLTKLSDALLVLAFNEERLKEVMRVAESKSGILDTESDVREVAAMLPTDAQWTGYWRPGKTIDLIDWSQSKECEEDTPSRKWPTFPSCSPVGVSATVHDNTIEHTIVLPALTIHSFKVYFRDILGSRRL